MVRKFVFGGGIKKDEEKNVLNIIFINDKEPNAIVMTFSNNTTIKNALEEYSKLYSLGTGITDVNKIRFIYNTKILNKPQNIMKTFEEFRIRNGSEIRIIST